MRKYLITLYYILSAIVVSSQNVDFHWAKSFNSNSHQNPNAIAVDSVGYSYITGYFFGTVDLDPGTGNYDVTSNGNLDVFVVKLDPSGNFVWGKAFGGTHEDRGIGIDVDTMGNVVLSGVFENMVDFDPGSAQSYSSNGNSDTFILKLDVNGNLLWVKTFGGLGEDFNNDLHLDDQGNVFVTGEYWVTVDFDPGNGDYNLTAVGNNSDVYILQLDTNGDFVWAKSIGGASQDIGRSIVQDKNGNVIVTGVFSSTADFDPGTSNFNLVSNGDWDAFVVKLDVNGDFVWAKSYGGPTDDQVFSVNTDMFGDLYLTGNYVGTVDFDPGTGVNNMTFQGSLSGNWDAYALKLDGAGEFLWSKSFGGDEKTHSVFSTTDKYGNLYMTGWFQDVSDFDPGSAVLNLPQNNTPNVFNDIFLLQLDRCGNLLWATSFHGESKNDTGVDVALDESCNLYLTGYILSDSVDFDLGSGINYLVNDNIQETFVSKYQVQCPIGIDEVVSCGAFTWIDGNTYTTNNNTAEFIIEGGNSIGCDSIVRLDLTIEQDPEIDLTYALEPSCEGVVVEFIIESDQLDNIEWDFGNGQQSGEFSPTQVFPYGNSYTVNIHGSNASGDCHGDLDTTVVVGDMDDYFTLLSPNVFTPNNDGSNDHFCIDISEELTQCTELVIYNRWGQKVFDSNKGNGIVNGKLAWDGNTSKGSKVPEGTYFYLLKTGELEYQGTISLMR